MQDVRGFSRELIGVNRFVHRRRVIIGKFVLLVSMLEQLVYKLETAITDRVT